MRRSTEKKITLIFIFFLVAGLFMPNMAALAQDLQGEIDRNLGQAQAETGLRNLSFPELLGTIIKAALSFIGIIFLVIIIYGGFLWMTAGGNSQQVEKAQSQIRNSIVGLIIIFLSYAIVFFVFDILLRAV